MDTRSVHVYFANASLFFAAESFRSLTRACRSPSCARSVPARGIVAARITNEANRKIGSRLRRGRFISILGNPSSGLGSVKRRRQRHYFERVATQSPCWPRPDIVPFIESPSTVPV